MPQRQIRNRQQTERARDLRSSVSKTERKLWNHLSSSKAGAPFRRQHPLGPYFLDYFCVPLKLAAEIDGPWHDRERDAARDAYLANLGVTVLRFGVQEVDEHPEAVVERIRHEVWVLSNLKQS